MVAQFQVAACRRRGSGGAVQEFRRQRRVDGTGPVPQTGLAGLVNGAIEEAFKRFADARIETSWPDAM